MAKQILNTGTSNNDKSGDTLRAGGLKIKANFNEIYAALANDGSNISGGDLLKTGSYTDLRNLPDFKTISITGSFDDLVDVPELSTYVSPPPTLFGIDGDLRGQIAADDEYVYLCTNDWVQGTVYSPLTFIHEENAVEFVLQAATSDVASTIILKPGAMSPEIDWTITNGVDTRTITLVTEIGDGEDGIWYECTLDGEFTSVADESYTISYTPPMGDYVACFTWNGAFQPIIDAHNLDTLSAKLFKSGDSVGRAITHAHRNSDSNKLTIVYSGDQFTSFTGMSIVNDQPVIWKRVPLTGSVASSIVNGNIAVTLNSGGTLVFPSNYTDEAINNDIITRNNSDLNIRTTRDSYGVDADIGIYAADDLWLTAEGDQVEITAANDIALYTSNNEMATNNWYVEGEAFVWSGNTLTIPFVEDAQFLSQITPYLSSTYAIWFEVYDNGSYRWVQSNTVTPITEEAGIYTIQIDTNNAAANLFISSVKLVDPTYNGSKQWMFNRNGSISFPELTVDLHNGGQQTGSVLQFGNTNDLQAIITGPTPTQNQNAQRLIIQGQRATGSGEGGDVYFWAGDSDVNGGDIKIYAGDADSTTEGYGGYVNIEGGRGFNSGGNVSITGGDSSDGAGGNVNIRGGFGATNGEVSIQSGSHYWSFNDDGNLALPYGGTIKDADGNDLLRRIVSVPTHSTGASGDLEGDFVFSNGYIYYCAANYVGDSISATTLASSGTVAWIDSTDYIGDLVADFNANPSGWTYNGVSIVSVTADDSFGPGYALEGTTPFGINNGENYSLVSGASLPDIWKRVAWSNDTW
jgi:hypothetical protein